MAPRTSNVNKSLNGDPCLRLVDDEALDTRSGGAAKLRMQLLQRIASS
jgi:hypothetical protein